MNHKKFVNHMKHTSKKLMNKKTWSSINLKYAIENNAYDGINVSKLINDNPKILNKLYHDNNNLLHIIIINYQSSNNNIFNYLLSQLHIYKKLSKFFHLRNKNGLTPLELGFRKFKLQNIYYTLLFIKNYIPSIYIVYNSPLFFKRDISRLILLLERNSFSKDIIDDCKQKLNYPNDKLWNSFLLINI